MHLSTIFSVLLLIWSTVALPQSLGLTTFSNHLTLIPHDPLSRQHFDVQEEYPQRQTTSESSETLDTIYQTVTIIITASSTTQPGFPTSTRTYHTTKVTPPTSTSPCNCIPLETIQTSWLYNLSSSTNGFRFINLFIISLTAPGCIFVFYYLVMCIWGSIYRQYRRWQGYEAAAREARISVGESASMRMWRQRERGILLGDEETGIGTGRWGNHGSVGRERGVIDVVTDSGSQPDVERRRSDGLEDGQRSWRHGRPVLQSSVV